MLMLGAAWTGGTLPDFIGLLGVAVGLFKLVRSIVGDRRRTDLLSSLGYIAVGLLMAWNY